MLRHRVTFPLLLYFLFCAVYTLYMNYLCIIVSEKRSFSRKQEARREVPRDQEHSETFVPSARIDGDGRCFHRQRLVTLNRLFERFYWKFWTRGECFLSRGMWILTIQLWLVYVSTRFVPPRVVDRSPNLIPISVCARRNYLKMKFAIKRSEKCITRFHRCPRKESNQNHSKLKSIFRTDEWLGFFQREIEKKGESY